MIRRYLERFCFSEDFGRQMRFIAGPRQTGKTYLAKHFLSKHKFNHLYYNWDERQVRSLYNQDPFFFETDVLNTKTTLPKHWVCFDEIHKYPKWKNVLKGIFDHFEFQIQLIVTGSARLDTFRKSGDSLAGRYFLFHLLPITLSELIGKLKEFTHFESAEKLISHVLSTPNYYPDQLEALMTFSGYPEPLTRHKDNFHRRWKQDYVDRLIREDLRDLTRIAKLENIERLMMLLPSRIGSPLSVNSLVRDLDSNYTSTKNYLLALEKTYIIHLISPYSKHIHRSIKKERKCYFFDWTLVEDLSNRFENFLAIQLLAWLSLFNDSGMATYELNYLRSRDSKESDFLIVKNKKPWLIIEAKLSPTSIDAHHYRFSESLGGIPIIQIVHDEKVAKTVTKKQHPNIRLSVFRQSVVISIINQPLEKPPNEHGRAPLAWPLIF